MRVRKCLGAKRVRNPADIKEKMLFYNEQTELTDAISQTLLDLCTPYYCDEEKDSSVESLEQEYKRITKCANQKVGE